MGTTNYNFKLYLESPDGVRARELFTFGMEEPEESIFEKVSIIYNQNKDIISCVDEESFMKVFKSQFYTVCDLFEKNNSEELTFEGFFNLIIEDLKNTQLTYREIPPLISLISLVLYCYFETSCFYPILFNRQFNELINRMKFLGISTPSELPLQKDCEERCKLYLELCEYIEEWQTSNELTKEETCALIYDYAAKCLSTVDEDYSDIETLPAPTNIWFAGAAKDDYKTSLEEKTSIWQGNPNTQVGDIVVLYALSPYSHIHSVWRAVHDATFNPFQYYCDNIEVGRRVLVPHISIKDLKADEIMSQMPIVKKNLQGLNGVSMSRDEYQHLQEMFKEKDPSFDLSLLPQLVRPEIDYSFDIETEKEKGVEEHLLIPLLTALGYSDQKGEDWDRQVVIKAGRNEKYIPDFVFFPRKLSDRQIEAPFVIEAKLDFKNPRQLKKDFEQGVSYARPLRATLLGICDKEQLRIYRADRHGLFYEDKSLVFKGYWSEMRQDEEVFCQLKKIIGREIVNKIK